MIDALTEAVDALVGVDVSARADSDIRETVARLRRDMDRQEAYLAELLVAVRHRSIPFGDGAASVPSWMQWHTGQRTGDARAALLLGTACESLPLTAKAWRQGEISTSAARTIASGRRREAEAEYAAIEDQLVGFAADRDFRLLDAAIRHYQARVDALYGKRPKAAGGVRLVPVGNEFAVRGHLDQLGGSTLDRAVRAGMDKPGDGDDRSFSQRFADSLVRVARFFLDYGDASVEGREIPHVTVLVDWDTLIRSALTPSTGIRTTDWLAKPDTSTFTQAQIAALLCESNISRVVVGPDSIPLDVGRAMRNPSRALRRAVVARDGCCRFPGCDRRATWCRTHHVFSWICGGDTKLCNLVLLCDFHHHIVHLPGWTSTFDGTTFTVTNPQGRFIGST